MPFEGHFAVIGGTGFTQLPPEIFAETVTVETPFGEVSLLSLSDNYLEPYRLYFLPRHGAGHTLAPHQINYRANIAALVQLGIKGVFATNAVGSLRHDLAPGSLVLMSDFLDFTRGRPLTYFAPNEPWRHTDFSQPYSPRLREILLHTAQATHTPLLPECVYLCTDGPRFETPAEVRLFAQFGADVVGMTGLPEAIFAKEAGLEYAALGIVTNLAAGLKEGAVTHKEHQDIMQEKIDLVRELLLHTVQSLYEPL
jgi:5'-methylthioadenosine phosphorylase